MLKTNIIGSIIVCAIIFGVVGYFFSIGLKINWFLYFKVLGLIAAIAVITSIASLGKSNN
jgi:hypothetical protein